MEDTGRNITRKLKENPACIKAGIAAAAAVLFSACLYISDNTGSVMTNKQGEKIIKRAQNNEDMVRKMKVRVGDTGEETTIEIPVRGREYDASEIQEEFAHAGEELEQLILGQNRSLDEVSSDLDLITEIPGKGIQVSWELDKYDVMDIRGNLREDVLTDEGTPVRLTAVLSYGEERAVHEFYANVLPPILEEEEQMIRAIQEEVARSDEKTKTEDYLILPERIDGKRLQWKYGTETRAFAVMVLGLGVSCMLFVSASQRKKEEEKKAAYQMKIDYPQIINKFNLYIRAGMTLRRAWFCIAQDYEKKIEGKDREKEKRKAYEEMIRSMRQIQGGIPEGEAYEDYGARCGISLYRKFGTMLSQNLRKGSKGLTDLLGREAEDAFEERKNLAKKLGEEAGTKLVIPLFLMLIIVFAIVIVPAFFSIRI